MLSSASTTSTRTYLTSRLFTLHRSVKVPSSLPLHLGFLPDFYYFFATIFLFSSIFFFFNDTATTEIYTLSLHDALPISYYDANDGNPAYLLLNDGHGNFTDATPAAGLEKKRRRRTYSASFVDLNDDGNLDLLVVSDFAGVDLYRNDGRGHFSDVTREWVAEPHAFGMAHALTDFNADGRLDILMIGMNSPVADRLEHLDLWRP